ncbi:excinuclease ABC subunit UvrA [Tractidigestivibacter sp.]|uniref:excinuclease ABC subunit UvrA n=1 Tax=Tractidigestivibacter sp. TaxID=2847320 RepID=UPI002A911B59|nr:excinuclease ABC subunit UvrA [Tractidigestivibacter sp.]MDY5270933.1 excinuclease ABC subunit UvrA [Tractidigestivibacter sp.]
MSRSSFAPRAIEVRGARTHNLRNVDVSVPLGRLVGIAGVSGSGKSSLALGVLYAEGSRRYLEALSTYTRRRLTQPARADVDLVEHVPAALALRQRPGVPGVRSTFGTSTELLNGLRLLFSRVGSYTCPNGHRCPPTIDVALERPVVCPVCGEKFFGRSAESLAFNGDGACPTCGGTGVMRQVNEAALVPDESKTIDEGAVAPWGTLMWSLMKDVCREMGVRTNVPFGELSPAEREIVFHGPAEKRHVVVRNKGTDTATELDFTYYSAVRSVENALAKARSESAMKRIARFLKEGPCPDCHGTRLSAEARDPMVCGINLAEATAMTLDELAAWLPGVVQALPAEVAPMAEQIADEMAEPVARLLQLGLGYLALDRASSTLSNGERQRVQLARAVRNRTTGVLYVLDEPSIGLHPSNVEGLLGVVDDLLADGNSVVVVDHDVRVLRHAEHLIEVGPGSGEKGGTIICQGSIAQVENDAASRIAPFLSGARVIRARRRAEGGAMFDLGRIHLETGQIHTVRPLAVDVPQGRMVAVTGVSGSGKTTLVLESLVPALKAGIACEEPPAHVQGCDAAGIRRVCLIDSTPIGANVRSTVATYSGVMDDLRRAFAQTADAKARGLHAGDFSYNTGSLRCPTCDGTGTISLDVQFLPDVVIDCPDCRGSRYARAAWEVRRHTTRGTGGEKGDYVSLPQLMEMTVDEALGRLGRLRRVASKLRTLSDIGLGYLTLGEATPALSGGEAQRLKLSSEIGRSQEGALFVFDEPTIGLHPLDVEVLLGVLQGLVGHGATVVVIEHDLDMIANADYVIDMGPGGGDAGGSIVCAGTPEDVAGCSASVTGRYLAEELGVPTRVTHS